MKIEKLNVECVSNKITVPKEQEVIRPEEPQRIEMVGKIKESEPENTKEVKE